MRYLTLIIFVALIAACTPAPDKAEPRAAAFRDIAAVNLNYRYEADVPAPPNTDDRSAWERNAAVQADFDSGRPADVLDSTITSPDKKYVVAVYHRVSDTPSEYRLDMYSADGKILNRITSDQMAVRFPDSIRWAPDSSSVAFSALFRKFQPPPEALDAPTPAAVETPATEEGDAAEPEPQASPQARPLPPPPSGILTLRTEQIYLANADGSGTRPVTQNEGIIYYHYSWAPDSSALAALAATEYEWRVLDVTANNKGEQMVPQGRPRVIERNGRERRLDDNLTSVFPVWSPDSSKVAVGYGIQIRIYDATGVNPTQAAIPLRNQLLLSSQEYDRQQRQTLEGSNTAEQSNTAAAPSGPASTLPDEKDLVSFNPIVELSWQADDILYFKTAYLKKMKVETESVQSFARWHRIIFSPQAAPQKQ
jgi:hypothetical protein